MYTHIYYVRCACMYMHIYIYVYIYTYIYLTPMYEIDICLMTNFLCF